MTGPLDDTIAAIATPQTFGPRGVVRLSGTGTHALLGRVLTRYDPATPAQRSAISLGPAVLPVLVLSFIAPRSYTGQDAAELITVGSPHVLRRVLEELIERGARQADPGEFSARSYFAGKLTLDQAESIAARIAASRDEELEAADRVRTGAFGRACEAWADALGDLAALVEAGIDFTDQEDVVPIPPTDLADGLRAIEAQIAIATGGGDASESVHREPSVVLVGPPNAGKSTLFNALLCRPRSVVSDAAGTTRDAISEPLDLSPVAPGGGTVQLVDLPGLDDRASLAPPDAAAQRAAADAIRAADLLIACDPSGAFRETGDFPNARIIRVRTKADLPAPRSPDRPADQTMLSVCALDGYRLDTLRRAIADAAELGSGGDAVVPRHRRALRLARAAIGEAISHIATAADRIEEPELVAAALRIALDETGSIAGQIPPDEVLGRVFSTFCVGK